MEREIESPKSFSYVDSASAFVYFNLTPSSLKERQDEINSLMHLREIERSTFVERMAQISFEILFSEYGSLFFHEWHHCLQTIFYPYRYLQSWRELSTAFAVLSNIRRSSAPLMSYSLELPEDWKETIQEASMVFGLNIEDGKLVYVNRDPDDLRPSDLTLTDLIEDATCIFQFKSEIGNAGTGIEYRHWIRTHKSGIYSNVFNLLSKLLGVEDAYTSLQPLVQASFSTTWPARTFIHLVNTTVTRKDHQLPGPAELGCDIYYELLLKILEREVTLPIELPNPNEQTRDDKFAFLDEDSHEKLVKQTPKHTVYPLAIRYLELVKVDKSWRNALFHPYQTAVTQSLIEGFLPPMTVIRLYSEPLYARDALLYINPALRDLHLEFSPDISYADYLPEVMKRKDIAYSIFSDLNNYLEHNCDHRQCPYHITNLCRRWSAIPASYSICPFPKWFVSVTGRLIDLESNKLRKVTA